MTGKGFILIVSIALSIACNLNAYGNRTLTFAQAADLAVAASVDLRHSQASLIVMEGAWRWGLRAYFPQVGISASQNDRLSQIGPDSFIRSYTINVDQLIFDFGTIMSRRLERMELNQSASRLDRMASDIAESAITAYRNVLSARAILDIRLAALEVLEAQRRILNEEVQLGLALAIDLASADISLAEARLEIVSLQLDLEEMEKQFAELLGLDILPILAERVDVYRSILLPEPMVAAALAREQNPDLIDARHSITRRQLELNFVSRSWIPTLRLNGSFGISGQQHPLTRYNWSVGVTLDLSTPWIQNRFGAQAGWEPPHDRTAMIQNTLTPLPDPAASVGVRQAALALALEKERYATFLERVGRLAASAVERCVLAEQRRNFALEAAALGSERLRIEEIRLGLGQITRYRLMEVFIDQTQREIAVVQAATALLEAERELERFLDLAPGELAAFAAFASWENL